MTTWNEQNPWIIQAPGVLRLNGTQVTIVRDVSLDTVFWNIMHEGITLKVALDLHKAKEYALKEVHTLIEVGIEP